MSGGEGGRGDGWSLQVPGGPTWLPTFMTSRSVRKSTPKKSLRWPSSIFEKETLRPMSDSVSTVAMAKGEAEAVVRTVPLMSGRESLAISQA